MCTLLCARASLPRALPSHSPRQIDADAFPELCERFQLESVPAFLFLHAGKLVDSVMGADAPALHNKVKQHDLSAAIAAEPETPIAQPSGAAAAAAAKPPLDDRLRALTHQAPVMLFMKGTVETPRCGFSPARCPSGGP